MNNYNLIVYAIENNFTLSEFKSFLKKSLSDSNTVNIYNHISIDNKLSFETFEFYREQNILKSVRLIKEYKRYLKRLDNEKSN